jgi:hypothetical protein
MTKQTAVVVLALALFGTISPAAAQNKGAKTPNNAGKKLESLLQAAEIPFTKAGDTRYIAVVTVDQDSERFQLTIQPLGDDTANDELYIVQMYFALGALPEGAQLSAALARQMVTWNSNLTVCKVIRMDNVFFLTATAWLMKTDSDTLALDAVLAHMTAKNLRKELAPYLKQ